MDTYQVKQDILQAAITQIEKSKSALVNEANLLIKELSSSVKIEKKETESAEKSKKK